MSRLTKEVIADGWATGICSLCAGESVVMWAGPAPNAKVEFCVDCVEHVAPALLADSVFIYDGPQSSRPYYSLVLGRAIARFWQVAAANLDLALRRAHEQSALERR